jgi:hypothetical protein
MSRHGSAFGTGRADGELEPADAAKLAQILASALEPFKQ